MCDEKTVADIDAGRSLVVKKKFAYSFVFTVVIGVIGWLITVIFWVAGTNSSIAKNVREIDLNQTKIIEFNDWRIKYTDGQNELIYNLTRLLEANGLEWKSFKK